MKPNMVFVDEETLRAALLRMFNEGFNSTNDYRSAPTTVEDMETMSKMFSNYHRMEFRIREAQSWVTRREIEIDEWMALLKGQSNVA